jgi:hypothetical protein
LALLQAEESACVLELVNVPNVLWQFYFFAGRQNKNSITLELSFVFPALHLTMAINPVRIDYLTVCGFIHSRYKFFVQVNIFSETVENLFSAGLTYGSEVKTYKLQHWIYSGLGCVT